MYDSNCDCAALISPSLQTVLSWAQSAFIWFALIAVTCLRRCTRARTFSFGNESLNFGDCDSESFIMADRELDPVDVKFHPGIPDSIKMSQLQNLLHDALIATEHVQQCAIVQLKDGLVQATSVGFSLQQDQVQTLVDAFKNPPQTREAGLFFGDRRFTCVRTDKNSIYAECRKRGLILVKTLSLLLVATYTENMSPSVCVEAVERLADYFKGKGK